MSAKDGKAFFEEQAQANAKSDFEKFKEGADKRNEEIEEKRRKQAAEKAEKEKDKKERADNKEQFANRLAMFGGGK
eukprot:NODE_1200_length_473_cov_141.430636_g1190_i0.p1 GENE.NODE_1200_length_473_cov_141.430636_g1190_i0~~NODE_1200_length_473_cov_141.430636_g1190_i0.p1  ORF type:complete len:76 (+),score=29.55 NODE_1200_length_473_cov_141.430636_g1190_i0:62-289(+)